MLERQVREVTIDGQTFNVVMRPVKWDVEVYACGVPGSPARIGTQEQQERLTGIPDPFYAEEPVSEIIMDWLEWRNKSHRMGSIRASVMAAGALVTDMERQRLRETNVRVSSLEKAPPNKTA